MEPVEQPKEQLCYYVMKVVARYTNSLSDVINIEKTNKKYRGLVEDYNWNCVKLQNEKEYNILAKNKRMRTFVVERAEELDEVMNYSNKPEEIVFRVEIKESQFNRYKDELEQIGCKCKNLRLIKETGEDEEIIDLSETEYSVLGSRSYAKSLHIRQVIIGPQIEEIRREVFFECVSLQKIYIPDSVTRIKSSTFERCCNLKEVRLSENIKVLPICLFHDCDKLREIELPSKLERIECCCFGECMSLTGINIPDSVTWLGSACFNACEQLVNVHLPTGITELKSTTFWACCKLSEIVIPNGVQSINSHCFEECEQLRFVELPTTLTRISNGAFGGCENLFFIQLPEGLKELGYGCFDGCGMDEVDIPTSVEVQKDIFIEDDGETMEEGEEGVDEYEVNDEDDPTEISESEEEDKRKDPNFRQFTREYWNRERLVLEE